VGKESGIGEGKAASEAAREAELCRGLLDMAGVGILLADPEGLILEVNERLCALLGREQRSLVGDSLVAPPDARGIAVEAGEAFERVRAEGFDQRELRLPRHDGGEVLLEMRAERVRDGSFRAVFRDVTEERKAEEELRLKTMFLEAVANSSADGILVVDPRGTKILQNRRTAELWNIPREIAEDPNGDHQVAHIMAFTKNPQLFLEEIEHQKKAPLEVMNDQLELVDGTVLDRHSAPVLGPEGGIYGRVYTFHDVTGFRRAEERIRGLLDEKEMILREVHHRVKNYMTTLQAILSLHARSLSDPSAVAALGDAQDRIQGMVMLYDKLYVQTGSGSMIASIYMRELVEEIVDNFPRSVELTIDQRYDDFALNAKTMQTLGIIVNELLTNIMKYAFEGRSAGRISVSVTLLDGRARLEIRDDGVGLPEAANRHGGIGFGLMLIDTLVKQLGGTMAVERDGGTRYAIEFGIAGRYG
jgi:PAS domain S-box-containing protein